MDALDTVYSMTLKEMYTIYLYKVHLSVIIYLTTLMWLMLLIGKEMAGIDFFNQLGHKLQTIPLN